MRLQRSEMLQLLAFASKKSIPKPCWPLYCSLCKFSALKMLKKFKCVLTETCEREISSRGTSLVYVWPMFVEGRKHSSNICLGICRQIGLCTEVLTSGWLRQAGFYCTPIYNSLNTRGFRPIYLSKRSGWLQTLRNYMTKFIRFSIFALFSWSCTRSRAEILFLMRW